MVVDHTPPVIEEASVRREPGKVFVTIRGKDALSLLDSAEFDFNNGVQETWSSRRTGSLTAGRRPSSWRCRPTASPGRPRSR
jgi:hypothetical protein